MAIGVVIVAVLVAGLIAAAVITIGYLTVKKLKELIAKRKKSKVAFGETRKIVEAHAREILDSAPSMTMDDLERTCVETPYFIVDYDPTTDEVSDYTTIKTESTEEKIDNVLRKNEGIVLFE